MIAIQNPSSISLDGSTRDLLVQVTRATDEINNFRPFSPDIESRIRTTLLPDRIVASLNMEGIVATRRQTLDVMDAMRLSESIGRGRQEIFNALKANEFICDCLERGVTFSESIIRETNKVLLFDIKPDAGEIRTRQVELPGAPFPPPSPPEIPALLSNLCELFPHSEKLHPIIQAAWLHGQFTLIHPFCDGNGRTGRLLQDYILIRRGLLPVGIPPSQRDDYYNALASSDKGNWNDLIEMIALLELSMVNKTIAIAKEPEKRAIWIKRLSEAAAAKQENTRHRQYLVWRQRMEQVSKTFAYAAKELDESSDDIGAQVKEYGVIEYSGWNQICDFGYMDKTWLFSVLFFADRKPIYRSIAFLERHRNNPTIDTFLPERDLVGLYLTGIAAYSTDRPNFRDYSDPHIRLRELLFIGDDSYQYTQETPGGLWKCTNFNSVEEAVELLFNDVFIRKVGLGS